jgi:hypothetical protein
VEEDCPGDRKVCISEVMTVTIPNGYCSVPCDPGAGTDTCPPGSRCNSLPFGPLSGLCLATCETAADCRESDGYTCVGIVAGEGVCFPDGILPG